MTKSVFKSVSPYQDDALNLPVKNIETAVPFYENVLGFRLESEKEGAAILQRDGIRIGLAENGGDPAQDGCFFEVDNAENAFAEFKENGLKQESPNFRVDKFGDNSFKVFFVVAPDGLCYCLGEKVLS